MRRHWRPTRERSDPLSRAAPPYAPGGADLAPVERKSPDGAARRSIGEVRLERTTTARASGGRGRVVGSSHEVRPLHDRHGDGPGAGDAAASRGGVRVWCGGVVVVGRDLGRDGAGGVGRVARDHQHGDGARRKRRGRRLDHARPGRHRRLAGRQDRLPHPPGGDQAGAPHALRLQPPGGLHGRRGRWCGPRRSGGPGRQGGHDRTLPGDVALGHRRRRGRLVADGAGLPDPDGADPHLPGVPRPGLAHPRGEAATLGR